MYLCWSPVFQLEYVYNFVCNDSVLMFHVIFTMLCKLCRRSGECGGKCFRKKSTQITNMSAAPLAASLAPVHVVALSPVHASSSLELEVQVWKLCKKYIYILCRNNMYIRHVPASV